MFQREVGKGGWVAGKIGLTGGRLAGFDQKVDFLPRIDGPGNVRLSTDIPFHGEELALIAAGTVGNEKRERIPMNTFGPFSFEDDVRCGGTAIWFSWTKGPPLAVQAEAAAETVVIDIHRDESGDFFTGFIAPGGIVELDSQITSVGHGAGLVVRGQINDSSIRHSSSRY